MQSQSIQYLFLLIALLLLTALACNLPGGGQETDDPILFALKDIESYVTGIILVIAFYMAV